VVDAGLIGTLEWRTFGWLEKNLSMACALRVIAKTYADRVTPFVAAFLRSFVAAISPRRDKSVGPGVVELGESLSTTISNLIGRPRKV
jgi:hypothetical protein